MMSLRKINRYMNEKQRKIQFSTQMALMNPEESVLFCDKCNKRLGLLRLVRFAWGKQKGEEYLIICRSCLHLNKRIKGYAGDKIEEDWRKYGI